MQDFATSSQTTPAQAGGPRREDFGDPSDIAEFGKCTFLLSGPWNLQVLQMLRPHVQKRCPLILEHNSRPADVVDEDEDEDEVCYGHPTCGPIAVSKLS